MLERRGMLSATIGSLADQALEDATPAEEYIAPVETWQDVGDGTVGLPEGVLFPAVNWGGPDTTELPPEAWQGGIVDPVENVWVAASYDDPTITAFIVDQGNDDVEIVDCGTCVFVSGFPLELAPTVPERAEFWGWSASDSVVDGTLPDAPATDDGGQSSPESRRFAMGTSNSRPTGELAAAAMWMNLSSTDAGGLQPTGGKRRSR